MNNFWHILTIFNARMNYYFFAHFNYFLACLNYFFHMKYFLPHSNNLFAHLNYFFCSFELFFVYLNYFILLLIWTIFGTFELFFFGSLEQFFFGSFWTIFINSSNAHRMLSFELLVVWTTTRGTTCNSSNDQLFKKSIVQTAVVQTVNSIVCNRNA